MKIMVGTESQNLCQQSATQADARMTKARPLPILLICLFLGELSALVMVVAIYMHSHSSLTMFLHSQSGRVFLTAAGACGFATAGIIHQYIVSRRIPSRNFSMTLGMNLFMIVLIALSGEMIVRLGTNPSREGERWRSKVLLPKAWEQVASAYRQKLEQASGRLTYIVYDDLIGWTIGHNRKNVSGLYYSSWEGIRAPHEDVSYVKTTDKTRIAIVGDSFTFAEDVAFEDSWGYHLEKELGADFEVLNFGVGGYGIDQAYLRYEKEVRQWNPTIVIIGLPSSNVERTMNVYHPLSSEWFDFPFAKPRFVLRDRKLEILNAPVLTPQELFSRRSIAEEPFLEYDRGYRPEVWQPTVLHWSYLARAVMSLFPPLGQIERPEISDAALISTNGAILRTFVQSVRSSGSIPIVQFFPESKEEFAGEAQMGLKVLQEAGLDYIDLTPCLRTIPPGDRFVPNHSHYSVQSNTRVAQCLAPRVRQALTTPLPAAYSRSSEK